MWKPHPTYFFHVRNSKDDPLRRAVAQGGALATKRPSAPSKPHTLSFADCS